MNELRLHPVAHLFPEMPAEDYEALISDIRTNGILVPVIVDGERQIIDGRHRWKASQELGITCPTVQWDGSDAWLAAQSANLARRHLSKEQVVAIRLLAARQHPEVAAPIQAAKNAARGRQAHGRTAPGKVNALGNVAQSVPVRAADKIGSQVGASGRTVRNVERAAKLDDDALRKIVEGEKNSREIVREHRTAQKRERTAQLEAIEVAPLLDTYPVVCADPPWRYESNTTPDTRAIENHYPTMELDDIKRLAVPADDDAVLFLWATNPKLTEALELMAAWGFTYRTNLVWVKDRIGMGYYARSQHEMLLVGRRGNLRVPDPEDRPPSVITAPRTEHSAKPVEAYAVIERMYPDMPRVEMFARQPRSGWAVWGNQAESQAA